MRKLLGFFLLFCVISLSAQQPALVPYPKSLVQHGGIYILKEKSAVYAANALLAGQEHYLRRELFKTSGIVLLRAPAEKQAAISLELAPARTKRSGAYRLSITQRQISIRAADPSGIFNGIQTLLQLVRATPVVKGQLSLRAMDIEDEPLYAWRGLMLDESRHFFGKEKVKQVLDWMALYKLNRFHWHLTDAPGWRMEIKKYPRLTLVGGIGNHTDPNAPARYYTQEEIQEVVAYAAERFIEVIPEVDMPGHATAANRAYPQHSGGGTTTNPEFTFNAGNEPTYAYLTNILKETQILFPSRYIHLGGDEVRFAHAAWQANKQIIDLKKRLSLTTEEQVEKYFMNRMADSVYAMGNKVLVWDEMIQAGLPADKTVIFWWRHDRPRDLTQALQKGYEVVLCPRLPLYFDFVQDSTHLHGRKWSKQFNDLLSVYRYDPAAKPLEFNSPNVLGLQANLWTETIQNEARLDYLTYPRIAALAEACWSVPALRRDEEFLGRLKTHMGWYKMAGLNFYDPFNPASTPEPPSKKKIVQNYVD